MDESDESESMLTGKLCGWLIDKSENLAGAGFAIRCCVLEMADVGELGILWCFLLERYELAIEEAKSINEVSISFELSVRLANRLLSIEGTKAFGGFATAEIRILWWGGGEDEPTSVMLTERRILDGSILVTDHGV